VFFFFFFYLVFFFFFFEKIFYFSNKKIHRFRIPPLALFLFCPFFGFLVDELQRRWLSIVTAVHVHGSPNQLGYIET